MATATVTSTSSQLVIQFATGVQGNGDDQLNQPSGLILNGDNLIVADCSNRRLKVMIASTGAFIRHVGGGEAAFFGGTGYPRGMSLDRVYKGMAMINSLVPVD